MDALTPSVAGMPQVPAADCFVMNNDDASPAPSDVDMDDDVDMGDESDLEETTFLDDTGARRTIVTAKSGKRKGAKSKPRVPSPGEAIISTITGGIKKPAGTKVGLAAANFLAAAAAEGPGRNTRSTSKLAPAQAVDGMGGGAAHTSAPRPSKPIPAINMIVLNLRGCGKAGRTVAGANGENRFRESNERKLKLYKLLTRLRRSTRQNSPAAVDIAFLQEFNTSTSPTTLLEARYREYQTLAATPGSENDMARPVATATSSRQLQTAAALYDSAILVHKRFGAAILQPEVSCPRATFVTVPDRGLLLVSIHGPFTEVTLFHEEIVATIRRYCDNGWTPIIGGDFNISPFPGDRSSRIEVACDAASRHIIPHYQRTLNVCDLANFLAPPPPPGYMPYSYSRPRRDIFTFKRTNGANGRIGEYIARIDLLLLPLTLISRPDLMCVPLDLGDFSDHAELRISVPASNALPASPVRRQFVVSHDMCSDPALMPVFEAILTRYESSGMFNKPYSPEHFSFYASLLED
ncbi:hypothetical protein GGI24_005134, partial [Coemansia furcata]